MTTHKSQPSPIPSQVVLIEEAMSEATRLEQNRSATRKQIHQSYYQTMNNILEAINELNMNESNSDESELTMLGLLDKMRVCAEKMEAFTDEEEKRKTKRMSSLLVQTQQNQHRLSHHSWNSDKTQVSISAPRSEQQEKEVKVDTLNEVKDINVSTNAKRAPPRPIITDFSGPSISTLNKLEGKSFGSIKKSPEPTSIPSVRVNDTPSTSTTTKVNGKEIKMRSPVEDYLPLIPSSPLVLQQQYYEQQLSTFHEELQSVSGSERAKNLQEKIAKAQRKIHKASEQMTRYSASKQVYDMDTDALSKVISGFFWDMFMLIMESDFEDYVNLENKNLDQPQNLPQSLRSILDFGLYISRIVMISTVLAPSPEERARVIGSWIRVAGSLQDVYGDFNGMYRIVVGLEHESIQRMKSTWDAVPKQDLKNFQDLQELVSSRFNYGAYHTEIQRLHQKPLIPLLPAFLDDIENMNKSVGWSSAVSEINYIKEWKTHYDNIFKTRELKIAHWLVQQRWMTIQQIQELSMAWEPSKMNNGVSESSSSSSAISASLSPRSAATRDNRKSVAEVFGNLFGSKYEVDEEFIKSGFEQEDNHLFSTTKPSLTVNTVAREHYDHYSKTPRTLSPCEEEVYSPTEEDIFSPSRTPNGSRYYGRHYDENSARSPGLRSPPAIPPRRHSHLEPRNAAQSHRRRSSIDNESVSSNASGKESATTSKSSTGWNLFQQKFEPTYPQQILKRKPSVDKISTAPVKASPPVLTPRKSSRSPSSQGPTKNRSNSVPEVNFTERKHSVSAASATTPLRASPLTATIPEQGPYSFMNWSFTGTGKPMQKVGGATGGNTNNGGQQKNQDTLFKKFVR